MSEKNEYAVTPPYVSASAFDRFLELAGQKSWPEVSSKLLRDNGFSEGQSFPILSGLKFLGLIDDDGKSSSLLDDITASTTEEQLRDVLRGIVENAYSDLIETIVVSDANVNQIDGYFRRRNIAPTVAKRSARFFIWLANRAGIEVGDSVELYKRSTKADRPKKKKSGTPRKPPEKVIKGINFSDFQSAEDYEKALLELIMTKAMESHAIPDFETIKQMRELINSIDERENKKRRSADNPNPITNSKQKEEEEA